MQHHVTSWKEQDLIICVALQARNLDDLAQKLESRFQGLIFQFKSYSATNLTKLIIVQAAMQNYEYIVSSRAIQLLTLSPEQHSSFRRNVVVLAAISNRPTLDLNLRLGDSEETSLTANLIIKMEGFYTVLSVNRKTIKNAQPKLQQG